MSDDQQLDPNAPWSPEEMNQLDADKRAELTNTQSSIPVLQEVIDWFGEQIEGFLNPNVIAGVNSSTNAENVKQSVLFAQQMSKAYSKKQAEFIARFKEYMDNVTEEE